MSDDRDEFELPDWQIRPRVLAVLLAVGITAWVGGAAALIAVLAWATRPG